MTSDLTTTNLKLAIPLFVEPRSLEQAKLEIWNLGKNLSEFAYLMGKNLIWVKTQVQHGNFLSWIEGNVWFGKSTAENFINFARKCDKVKTLLDYQPGKFPTVGNLPPLLPLGVFDIILADPPWQYDFSLDSKDSIEAHYPTMPLGEIKELRLPVADNAVLFLWATAPLLSEALEVMEAWGFTYRTNAVWDKEKLGMGYWFRGQHELLLVGVRGDFSPPSPEARYRSVIREARTNHSQKPHCVYGMLEAMFPDGKYLELFARSKRDGWQSWGNEL